MTRDRAAVGRFSRQPYPFAFGLKDRIALIRAYLRITHRLRGYHTLAEMLEVTDAIFRLAGTRELTVVEAGAGSGSSTAKLSLAARAAGARLVVFDSFRGIPDNDEQHQLLDGTSLRFRKGAFRGRLAAVKRHVETLGAIEVCEFRKGLFEDTVPSFVGPAHIILLDVDLVASTRVCTKHLFGQLVPGGTLFSQDGHLRATVELFQDEAFWRSEVGVEPPEICGLGTDKLVRVRR